jgi:Domain of unknown function (DUF1836).
MSVDVEEILNSILEQMGDIMQMKSAEIPNISLYMDQVTTFMNDKLEYSRRDHESKEPIFTKTMINNYAKNNLIPPPEKKKYSKEHMMILILIYYFKNIMSIGDIQVLTAPLTAQYFPEEAAPSMQEIYDQVFAAGEQRMDGLKEDLYAKYETSLTLFEDVPKEDREYLQLFSYVCLLSYDIFIKKLLIERIVDEMKEQTQPEAKGKKEKNKSGKE